MTQDEIINMWHAANGTKIKGEQYEVVEAFAKLVARHEREKVQMQLETLGRMYELASSQRDELMDQQRAQIAAMRGRMQ
jgi:copper oxidase (laccase) domain-containing protein